jgi:hypothetical protein
MRARISIGTILLAAQIFSMFGWLVADDWCWFVLREEYCWLVAGGWFVLREKYCWLVADKPSEQAVCSLPSTGGNGWRANSTTVTIRGMEEGELAAGVGKKRI